MTTMSHVSPARKHRGVAAVALAFVLAHAPGPASAGPGATLRPYAARYQVSYKGLRGGELESSFRQAGEPGLWLYESRVYPNILGRLAVSSQARERSTMSVTPAGVRPLAFSFNDGSENSHKDVQLSYDWAAGKATGTAEGKAVAYDLAPGTHDTASVQAAVILDLLAGRKPQAYRIITGDKIGDYRYWTEGTQQVMTPWGQFEAEIWASQRNGSNRISKVWYAPALGYVPVQAVQYRKGNVEVQMKLVKLQRESAT